MDFAGNVPRTVAGWVRGPKLLQATEGGVFEIGEGENGSFEVLVRYKACVLQSVTMVNVRGVIRREQAHQATVRSRRAFYGI